MENKSTPRVAASLSAGPLLAVQQTMKESLNIKSELDCGIDEHTSVCSSAKLS